MTTEKLSTRPPFQSFLRRHTFLKFGNLLIFSYILWYVIESSIKMSFRLKGNLRINKYRPHSTELFIKTSISLNYSDPETYAKWRKVGIVGTQQVYDGSTVLYFNPKIVLKRNDRNRLRGSLKRTFVTKKIPSYQS